MSRTPSNKDGNKPALSDQTLDVYLDSEKLPDETRAKVKAEILALIKFAKDGFSKPAGLRTRPRAKPDDLDEQVKDVELVRAAGRLVAAHKRRKNIPLDAAELEQVRAARRLVRAAERRCAADRRRSAPAPR